MNITNRTVYQNLSPFLAHTESLWILFLFKNESVGGRRRIIHPVSQDFLLPELLETFVCFFTVSPLSGFKLKLVRCLNDCCDCTKVNSERFLVWWNSKGWHCLSFTILLKTSRQTDMETTAVIRVKEKCCFNNVPDL